MKPSGQKKTLEMLEKSGGDYVVFMQIRGSRGRPECTVEFSCSKKYAKRVAALMLPTPEQRMKP